MENCIVNLARFWLEAGVCVLPRHKSTPPSTELVTSIPVRPVDAGLHNKVGNKLVWQEKHHRDR